MNTVVLFARLKKMLLTAGLVLLTASSLFAHPLDEINHYIVFKFRSDSAIEMEYSLYLGAKYQIEWTRYDTPFNKALEETEQDKWTDYVLQNILLKVNETPLELRKVSAAFPVYEDFVSGKDPYLRFKFETVEKLPDGPADVKFSTFVYDKAFSGRVEYGWSGKKLTVHQQELSGDARGLRLDLSASENDTVLPLKNPPPVKRNSLVELLDRNIWWALLLAFAFGLLHALQPGHGKTIVGAYLIASEGRTVDAVVLGLIVTLTHTLAVIALAAIVSYLISSGTTSEESVTPWLMLGSGGIIAIIGVWMFIARGILGHTHTHPHSHSHSHGHNHDEEHDHVHCHNHENEQHTHIHEERHSHEDEVDQRPGWWSLFSLGVSGGMVPCPEALALLIFAVGAGQSAKALALILSFSAGLALVLIAIGIIMVLTKKMFAKSRSTGRVVRILPFVSSVFITIIGAGLVLKSLEVMKVVGPMKWLPF